MKMKRTTINRRTMMASSTAGLVGTAFGVHESCAAQSSQSAWWGWRGPSGTNHAVAGNSVSNKIDPTRAAWAIDIPGRGHSSPIVTSDSIYLTTADKSKGTQSVLSISRDGKPRWTKVIHSGGIPRVNHPKNTEASPSVAFDGEALFTAFYNSKSIQLTKLTPAGQIIWQQNVGDYSPRQYKYGYAASPLLYKNTLILPGDFDGPGFLAAVDRETGETKWKIRRPGKLSFSSPIVANISGREQLLLSGAEMVAGYDPHNGELIWKAEGATTMATCGTMVWDGERVFASGGYPKPETVCIAADGSGRVIWSNSTKCYEQSMLYHDGYVYAVADTSIAHCWRATDGKLMWRQRLGGKYSSSPLLVGDVIHVFNEAGSGFAFKAIPEQFQSLGTTKVGDEVFASPVVVDDRMYLRVANRGQNRQESLMAIA